jgi:DNA-binding PadR family transcriptional regulator
MPKEEAVTAQAALLRVLFTGKASGPEIMRKIRDWNAGHVAIDEPTFATTVLALEAAGLVERVETAAGQRGDDGHPTFALTPAGQTSAVELLAASLTRKT